MDATGLEAGAIGELAEDEEGAGSGQRPATRVEEEIGSVATIEVRAAEREVAADGFGCGTAERYEAFLRALPDDAYDALLQRDAVLLQADGFGDAQAGAVEELDERAVAKPPRGRTDRCIDEAFGLGGRESAR